VSAVLFRPIVVIPVYNHGASALRVVAAVRAHGLPCIVVDDGSRADCAALLDGAAVQQGVHLVRLARNLGKGGAVMAGFRAAQAQGFTHALQIDADGQHDTADIPAFVALGRAHPQAVICGTPVYDRSVPKGRLYGRYVTHVWVWIHTLSFAIRDSMCGFRLYPLQAVGPLLDGARIGQRMDFDTEVLVRLYWRGVPVVNRPTRVTYPADGVSHFRVWRDNLLISRMHARLFLGMLLRLPRLLARKVAG
jgi:glycosyltransferase involved in cell wall biosynthesis